MPRRSKIGPLPPARRKRPLRRAPTKRPPRPKPPRLHVYSILAWADDHHRRTGRWPIITSGVIHAAPWDTWARVDAALKRGTRGCRPGGSLALLLHRHRGKPYLTLPRPRLTVRQILAWADAWHRRTGSWPTWYAGGGFGTDGLDTWSAVDHALHRGTRGLQGGDSLAKVLVRYRGVRRAAYRPRLTIKQILAWADAFHARTGRWPSVRTGPVQGVPGERWMSIHAALENARRGLPRGYTLGTLLTKYRPHRYRRNLPPFTESGILAWADAHYRRHGRWPTHKSGPIREAWGETWGAVEKALTSGVRGQPGGESLSKFLARHGRHPYRQRRHHSARHDPLSVEQILAWADAFHLQNARWPAPLSGPIPGTRDETWTSVDRALRLGMRGLEGGSSVALLLEKRRGLRHARHRPPFTVRDMLAWADRWQRREGRWPNAGSGPIPESPGDTWAAVETALRNGCRGLPGGDTLFRLLQRHGRLPPASRT